MLDVCITSFNETCHSVSVRLDAHVRAWVFSSEVRVPTTCQATVPKLEVQEAVQGMRERQLV